MNSRGSKKIKQSQRQRMSYRLIVATGIALSSIALVLVIYFQFFNNEIIKAEKPVILTQDQLPVDLEVAEIAIIPADTNVRDGVRYKVAKPLQESVSGEQ